MHAQRAGPPFHDLVNLLPGQILGQHLQVGGRGIAARRPAASSWWALLWRLAGPGPVVVMAKTAAVNKTIAAAGRDREVVFKRSFLAGWDGFYPMDGILTKKDAFAY